MHIRVSPAFCLTYKVVWRPWPREQLGKCSSFQTISQPLSLNHLEMHSPPRFLFKPLRAESRGGLLPTLQLVRLPSGKFAQSPAACLFCSHALAQGKACLKLLWWKKLSHPGVTVNRIILAEFYEASYDIYSRVKEWSHLPDTRWFPHSLPDSYKQNVNGAWQEEIKERKRHE